MCNWTNIECRDLNGTEDVTLPVCDLLFEIGCHVCSSVYERELTINFDFFTLIR